MVCPLRCKFLAGLHSPQPQHGPIAV
jgi:hypothetical protein